MEEHDKNQPQLYVNRELSWLKFNQRVLEEAQNKAVPLCERITFLSIYQSNLDEFFMVRVGTLTDQMMISKKIKDNKTKMTSKQQILAITEKVTELNTIKDDCYDEVMEELEGHGISIRTFRELKRSQRTYLEQYFQNELAPLLSPTIVGKKQPFPFLNSQEIYALAVMEKKNKKKKIGIIPCTSTMLPRLVPVPGQEKNVFMLMEDLILHFMPLVFPGHKIIGKTLMRITRNADIDVLKAFDEDLDYRDTMEMIVKQRKKLAPIRLEFTRDVETKVIDQICEQLELSHNRVFYSEAPLDLSFLFSLGGMIEGDTSLFYNRPTPRKSPNLDSSKPIIPQILKKDVLLSYPYESIQPFLNMLMEAARDPKVACIRMTLYRLARNSKIVDALVEAAENGKQVDVVVELRARFDEENNIGWSRTLEDAGCHVIYGIEGLKVHSKLCLITRKTEEGVQYITQIGTGNYNEKTSKLYTDLSLITARQEIGVNANQVFLALLRGEVVEESEHLMVAPKCLQNKIIDKIDQEIAFAKKGEPSYIGVKINSLTDKRIIDKLIEASQAGVKIEMVIRGINCLRTKVPGYTDNIRVISIVGRFLEHSRIYIFGTPDRDSIYISSADYMTRNTLRRVEVAAPIYDDDLKTRVREMFQILLSDNVKGREQQKDGSYRLPNPKKIKHPVNSQELFYEMAYEAENNCEKENPQQ